MKFNALLSSQKDGVISTELVQFNEDDLMPGDVTVKIDYSTMNYKDALALTGKLPIIQKFPLIPGIDFAGVVESSSHPDFIPGDRVVLNGWALSQTHHGGYAQRARVKGDWLVKIPDAFTTKDAMAIGTAGYTAMLCVLALEHGGVNPSKGDVLVTGSNGGVGSIATAILAKLGYRIVAVTGRPEDADYLYKLGATEVIDREAFSNPNDEAVGEELWAGVVDVAGSHTLANAMAQTKYRGVIAACGIAQGTDLYGSMLTLALRNITLSGIDSVNAPKEIRQQAWDRLGTDLDVKKLSGTVQLIGLADVLTKPQQFFEGKVRGRIVVDVNS